MNWILIPNNTLMDKNAGLILCCLISIQSFAEEPPSAEFWEYMNEFGDTSAAVFDAIDLVDNATIHSTNSNDEVKNSDKNVLNASVKSKTEEEKQK